MKKKYTKKMIHELRERWQDQEPRIKAIINDLQSGKDWTKNLLKSEEKGWQELAFLPTCPSKFEINGDAAPRDLRGLELENYDLSGTDGLADSCMDFCIFREVLLDSASLIGASIRYAEFDRNCLFSRAKLQYTDLRFSNFPGVSFEGADFTGADLRGANFVDSILLKAKLKNFKYKEEKWYGFLSWLWRKKWTRFGGEFQSAELLESTLSSLDTRFIEGENLRWIFKRKHPLLGSLWYILANSGRSPTRLLFWFFVIWLFFGFIYAGYPLPSSLENTPVGDLLCWFSPEIDWQGVNPPESPFRPYYFSAVTMTTLGFGDITPTPRDWKAQVYICIQVFLGYLLLGMFIGILIHNANNPIGTNL